jgi:hypothetical protein
LGLARENNLGAHAFRLHRLSGVDWHRDAIRALGLHFSEILKIDCGPDALEMECLFQPRQQISVSDAADCDAIVCYG